MNYRNLIILLLPLIISFQAGAQEEESENFVEDFNPVNNIRTGLRYKDYNVRFSDQNSTIFTFRNAGLNTFLGGRYGKIGLSLSVPTVSVGSVPDEQSKRISGNLHLYQRHWYLHLTGQRLTGFSEISANTQTPSNFRSDITFKRFGIYGFWIKSNDLSLRASFKHSQRQLQSKGSWLLASTINFHHLVADSIALPLMEGGIFSFDRFQQIKIGLGVGYAYTWVFAPKWYITPVIVAGPEFRLQNYRQIDQAKATDQLNLSPRLRGRLALGYNGDQFFSSLKGYWLPGYDIETRFNTRVNDLQLSLTFGYRLKGEKKSTTQTKKRK